MLKNALSISIAAAIIFSLGITHKVQSKGLELISPLVGKRIKLKVGKVTRNYWEINHEDTTFVEVSGPTKLKVYTRAAMSSKRKDVLFGLVVLLDDEKRFFVGQGSSRSKTIKNPKLPKQRLSEARTFEFNVPSGEHRFSFILPSMVKHPVYSRFLIEKPETKEINYIAFLPLKAKEEIKLNIKEREYIYYQTTAENPVELEVIGPTRIRGVARLEFDHTIRGVKSFRIQVTENDKIIQTQPLNGQISGTATYVNRTNKIPAKGENFYLNVPEGIHRFKVRTPDKGISVLLRFYIPEKDLGNLAPHSDRASGSFLRQQNISGAG